MKMTIIVFIWLLFMPAILYAQPSIVFDLETKDVGVVTAGKTIEHVFEIKNAGDKDLVIEKIVPS